MLDWRGIQLIADLFVVGDPILTTVAIDANLDQLMGLEANVDFLEDRVSQAIFGDRDDRIQSMRLGTQFAALICRRLPAASSTVTSPLRRQGPIASVVRGAAVVERGAAFVGCGAAAVSSTDERSARL